MLLGGSARATVLSVALRGPGDATGSKPRGTGAGGTRRCVCPPCPRVSVAAVKRVGRRGGGPCEGPGGAGGWEGAGEGWGGFNLPRGGLIPDPQCGVAPHKDMSLPNVPSPGQARQRWHTGGEPRGVPVPRPVPPQSRSIPEHPGDSGGSPSFTAARLGLGPGSPSPKSLGGRQTRGLERNQGYRGGGGWGVCLCRGGSVRPAVTPRWCLPSPEPKRGLGGFGFGTQRTLQPFRIIPMLRLCGCLRERGTLQLGGGGGGCPHCADPHRHRSPFWGQPPAPPRT